jgi:hypothetical protein
MAWVKMESTLYLSRPLVVGRNYWLSHGALRVLPSCTSTLPYNDIARTASLNTIVANLVKSFLQVFTHIRFPLVGSLRKILIAAVFIPASKTSHASKFIVELLRPSALAHLFPTYEICWFGGALRLACHVANSSGVVPTLVEIYSPMAIVTTTGRYCLLTRTSFSLLVVLMVLVFCLTKEENTPMSNEFRTQSPC